MAATIHKTEFYFDREAVRRQVEQMTLNPEALNRSGALVRTIAQQSIRHVQPTTPTGRRSKAYATYSRPGQAPKSRDAAKRYKRIEYFWSTALRGMVISHVGLPRKLNTDAPSAIHEFGRTARVVRRVVTARGSLTPGQQKRNAAYARLMQAYGPFVDPKRNRQLASHPGRKRATYHVVTANYPRRPVFGPALDRARDRLPGLFAAEFDRSRGGVNAYVRSQAPGLFS